MVAGKSMEKGLIFGIIALFIVSTVAPMVIGHDVGTTNGGLIDEVYAFYRFDEHHFPEGYSPVERDYLGTHSYDVKPDVVTESEETTKTSLIETKEDERPQTDTSSSLVGSPWPMQGYNRQHIGRSPYSTASNPGIEKWRFAATDWTEGSPVIGEDGTIYFGGDDAHLYAVYPNGTLKWKFEAESGIGSFGISPAIANDGTLYFSTIFGSHIQAVNPNGTAKWKRWTSQIETSITLDNDGVLYYGAGKRLEARYPNGTLKWKYQTGDYMMSTPTIDEEGIVYFGSHSNYIYALYPNGTLKWTFTTGSWIHGSPTIGEDGTIYCGSDDTYLYALYPNGTMKWRCEVGSMLASPSLDKDGNLYFGVWENQIYSVSPDGAIRWNFTIGDNDGVWGSTAAISDDGIVYIGVCIDIGILGGGEIIALDLDGNLKWRKVISNSLACTSPVISEEGSVYICASNSGWPPDAWGYLHAFGPVDPNVPPETPTIEGPVEGLIKEYYKYNVSTDDADNNPVAYFIDWGDGTTTGWTRDYAPGLTVRFYHTWNKQGNFTVKAKARDTFSEESDWAYLEVTMPKNQQSSNMLFIRFLERHPRTFPILRQLLGL